MKYISIEYALKLHSRLIKVTGGSNGIRDKAALESALANAQATFGGQDLYPTVEEKCANICYSLISNHPFTVEKERILIKTIRTILLK